MQKKSHKRKFKVGQLVKVIGGVPKMIGKEYKIEEYSKCIAGSSLNYRISCGLPSLWFSAKELEAVETPEEFFEEKETDGPIARILLKVLEILPHEEDYGWSDASTYTCDLIEEVCSENPVNFYEVIDFLNEELGFESRTNSLYKFDEFSEGFERQSARFNWILFALMIAREQGV